MKRKKSKIENFRFQENESMYIYLKKKHEY